MPIGVRLQNTYKGPRQMVWPEADRPIGPEALVLAIAFHQKSQNYSLDRILNSNAMVC